MKALLFSFLSLLLMFSLAAHAVDSKPGSCQDVCIAGETCASPNPVWTAQATPPQRVGAKFSEKGIEYTGLDNTTKTQNNKPSTKKKHPRKSVRTQKKRASQNWPEDRIILPAEKRKAQAGVFIEGQNRLLSSK